MGTSAACWRQQWRKERKMCSMSSSKNAAVRRGGGHKKTVTSFCPRSTAGIQASWRLHCKPQLSTAVLLLLYVEQMSLKKDAEDLCLDIPFASSLASFMIKHCFLERAEVLTALVSQVLVQKRLLFGMFCFPDVSKWYMVPSDVDKTHKHLMCT